MISSNLGLSIDIAIVNDRYLKEDAEVHICSYVDHHLNSDALEPRGNIHLVAFLQGMQTALVASRRETGDGTMINCSENRYTCHEETCPSQAIGVSLLSLRDGMDIKAMMSTELKTKAMHSLPTLKTLHFLSRPFPDSRSQNFVAKKWQSPLSISLFSLINFNASLIFPSPLSAAQRSQRSPH